MPRVSRSFKLVTAAVLCGWTLLYCGAGLPPQLFGAAGFGVPPPRSVTPPFGPAGLSQTTLSWWFDWSFGVPAEHPPFLYWLGRFQRDLSDAGLTIDGSTWSPPLVLGIVVFAVAVCGSLLGALLSVWGRPNASYHLNVSRVKEGIADGVVSSALGALLAAHAALFIRAAVILLWVPAGNGEELAGVSMSLWGAGTAAVWSLGAALLNGRAWYERSLAGVDGCPSCGYPRERSAACTECGSPLRPPRRRMRLAGVGGVAMAALSLAGALLLVTADSLRGARGRFQDAYSQKAFVLLVPGELVDAKVDGRWLTLRADVPSLGSTPDLLVRPADEPASPFTRLNAEPHGIMLGTRNVLWTWDASDKGAWKGWALVLIFEREQLEDVRRCSVWPRLGQR